MERGLELTRRMKMPLTYRGQKYKQNKAAASKQNVVLTYRGSQYQI